MGSRSVSRQQLAGASVGVAPTLLGAYLVSEVAGERVEVRLTEVEAYAGEVDPASHAYRGRTPRNAVMFGPAGHLYVYFTYGMHFCCNVVCGPDGTAAAVLLRAGEVVEGLELARRRRPAARSDRELARGPARLAAALGLGRAQNGVDLLDPAGQVRLAGRLGSVDAERVEVGPRVGVSSASDLPWRFWITGEPTVSSYRRSARPRPPGRGRGGSAA